MAPPTTLESAGEPRRPRRLLLAIPVVVLAASAVGGWWFLRADDTSMPAASVEAAEQLVEVAPTTLRQTLAAEGTIEAETTADLTFDVSGTVAEVLVAAGDEVVAGQVLARIDSAELAAAVVEAEAAVETAEAARDEAEDDPDATETEVAARQSQLASARLDLAGAEEALAGATLAAPVDGSVSSVGYQVGDVLGAGGQDGTTLTGSGTGSGQAAAGGSAATAAPGAAGGSDATSSTGIQVVSVGTYLVTVQVDATEIDQVEVGQVALVTPTTTSSASSGAGFPGAPGGAPGGGGVPGGGFPGMAGGDGTSGAAAPDDEGSAPASTAAGAQVEGLVTSVGQVAGAQSGVATFSVEVVVEGSPDEFFPGAVAEVEIVHGEIVAALVVPSLAISREGGEATVVVADGDDREERVVTTGTTSGVEVEVVEGLSAGETVVVSMPGGGGGGPGGAGGVGPGGFEGRPDGLAPSNPEEGGR